MVETSFSSGLCKLFSLWPVGIAHTGMEHEKRLQLQFFSFREPAHGWLCRITLSHLPCPPLVSAATGQSSSYSSVRNLDLMCLQLPSAYSAQGLGVSAMELLHVSWFGVSPHLLELC